MLIQTLLEHSISKQVCIIIVISGSNKGFKLLSTFELLIVLSLKLIRCGDIELNPGLELDSDTSSSTASAFSDLELKNKFSVIHNNVQSILLLTVLRRYFFCESFMFFLSCACYAFVCVSLYVSCSHLLGKG